MFEILGGVDLPFDAENVKFPFGNLGKIKSFGPAIKICKL